MPTRVDKTAFSEEAYQRHRGELTRLLEEYKTADAKEKAALRADIDELKEQLAEERKAKEAKEKDEGTGGTLVLPPESVPQGQSHGDDRGRMDNVTHHDTKPGEESRKGRWKKAW